MLKLNLVQNDASPTIQLGGGEPGAKTRGRMMTAVELRDEYADRRPIFTGGGGISIY